MTGAAANVPEEEETLRALLRSLRACMIRPRERAEEIACLDLDNYRWAFPKDEHVAQTAFDDDVDHAEEVLECRAIVVADLVGEAMSGYAGAHSSLDDPWMAWRREPPTVPAAAFVHGLNEEEFFCARVAYHVHSSLSLRRPPTVPTDGDLEDISGHLETEQAGTWREWLGVLFDNAEMNRRSPYALERRSQEWRELLAAPGFRQEEVRLSLATTAAKRDLTEGHTRSGSEVETRIAELADQVAAFQMPTIERLESIGTQIDALAAPNRFKAEELLKEALGADVYSSLSDDARIAVLDAERRFRDRETLDWNSVVSELAKAFEIQVKQQFVPCLARYLKQKGVMVFPDGESLPNRNPNLPHIKKQAIIRRGEAVPSMTLGVISIALTSTRPELEEFGRSSGLDLPELKKLIDNLSRDRNRGTHETGMSFAEAWRIRADWLGVSAGDGGIFGALRPKGEAVG